MPNSRPAPGTGRRKEDAHLREIERLARKFLSIVTPDKRRFLAPVTAEFLDHVGPVVEQLDDVREGRRRHKKK